MVIFSYKDQKHKKKIVKFVVIPGSGFTENHLQEKSRKSAHRYLFFSTNNPKGKP